MASFITDVTFSITCIKIVKQANKQKEPKQQHRQQQLSSHKQVRIHSITFGIIYLVRMPTNISCACVLMYVCVSRGKKC